MKKFTITLINKRGGMRVYHLTKDEFARFIKRANHASKEAWSNGYVESYLEGMNDVWELSVYNNFIKEDVTFTRIVWFLREPESIYAQAVEQPLIQRCC